MLLDLDDTLLDEAGARQEAAARFHALHAGRFEMDAGSFAVRWEAGIARHFARFTAGEVTFAEHRRARLREVHPGPLTDAEADALFAEYVALYEVAWRPFPDVGPFLERHAGDALGIVTNGNGEQQRRKLARSGLATHFEVIVISEEAGCAKPDARIFHQACRELGRAPGEVLFVGDNPDLDVAGSRAAGLMPIWLRRTGGTEAPDWCRVVGSLDEL